MQSKDGIWTRFLILLRPENIYVYLIYNASYLSLKKVKLLVSQVGQFVCHSNELRGISLQEIK